MTTVIRQTVGDNSQTIRQVVTSNDRGAPGPQGTPGGTIQYTAGTGINISDENVISATGKTSAEWGQIVGSMSNQTDLKNALNTKANTSSLATVATTGQYSDLTGTPSLATVATTGSYTDLTNKPTVASFIDIVYPVGSYYETSDTSFDPNVTWVGTTWVEDTAGRVLVASDTGTFTTVGNTGGEEKHTLTTSEMPSHNHALDYTANSSGTGTTGTYGTVLSNSSQTIVRNATVPTTGELAYWGIENAGGGNSHNNLQPYIVVKRWHRTA